MLKMSKFKKGLSLNGMTTFRVKKKHEECVHMQDGKSTKYASVLVKNINVIDDFEKERAL
jgi:hypothetical protein